MQKFSLIFAMVAACGLFGIGLNSVQADSDGSDCKLVGNAHDDNDRSKEEFKQKAYSANICELANCVDSENCANDMKVDWGKFQSSPAFTNADDDIQEKLVDYHEDGKGASGLVGYEILKVVEQYN